MPLWRLCSLALEPLIFARTGPDEAASKVIWRRHRRATPEYWLEPWLTGAGFCLHEADLVVEQPDAADSSPQFRGGGGNGQMTMKSLARFAACLTAALFIVAFGFFNPAKATDINPLKPIDASSPRATLQGFVEIIDELYLHMADLLKSYAASDRLYLSPEERNRQIELLLSGSRAVEFLDTSGILPVLRDTIAI